MAHLFWIAVAGAAGTLARYGVQRGAVALLGEHFPWGTLAVNALGCLIFGLYWGSRSGAPEAIPAAVAAPLTIGFLGAFTTFSTFAFETDVLLRQGAWGAAAANLLLNLVLGLVLFAAGFLLTRAR
jgi:CrcB protein